MKVEKDAKRNIMKKEIYIPIFGLIVGELTIFYDNIFYGLGIHTVNILAITLMIIFRSSLDIKMKNILRCICLVIILRMINLSIPQIFTTSILQYLLIYGIMTIPIYYIIKDKLTLYKESRIDSRKFYIYLATIFLIVFMTIILQYGMFNPLPLEVIDISGKFTTVCLIVSMVITLLLSDTKYWNKYISDTLDMNSHTLLSAFIVMAISKIISVT